MFLILAKLLTFLAYAFKSSTKYRSSDKFHKGLSWTEGQNKDFQFLVLPVKNNIFSKVILLDNSFHYHYIYGPAMSTQLFA